MENIIESHLDEKQTNATSDMIPLHSAFSLHGVISVLQLHTTLSKNHYNIFKFDSQKWCLFERSKSTYCTSGLNSRPRVIYRVSHIEMFLLNCHDRQKYASQILFEGNCIFLRLGNLIFNNQFTKNQHRLASTAPARKFNMSFHDSVK